jgi:hypothetical protein
VLPLEAFAKDRNRWSGRNGYCRHCDHVRKQEVTQ